jgi:hypothetical protein
MSPRADSAPKSFAGQVGRRVRPVPAALIVCALSVLALPVFEKALAEPPSIFKEPVDPAKLAQLAVGVSLDPSGGPLGLMAVLAAGEHPDFAAWVLPGIMDTPARRAGFGTVTLLGGATLPAGPLASVAFLDAGAHFSCWRFLDTDRVTPIPASALDVIRDRTPADHEGKEYWRILFNAGQTSDLAFRGAARTEWRLRPIEKDPAAYRGGVFYLEAVLKSVDRLDVPPAGRDEWVSARYRAVLEDSAQNVYVIHFTEIPSGTAPKEADDRVSFAGYFYKLVPRENGAAVPLFIGRTFQPLTSTEERLPQATTALLLSCQAGPAEATAPLTALALFRAAEHLEYWKLFTSEGAPTLRRELFVHIKAKGYFPGVDEDADPDFGELRAYYDFLVVGSRTPPEVYAREARTNVPYEELIHTPSESRGDIVHKEGTLTCLRRVAATRDLERLGIPYLYEALVFEDGPGKRPCCLVLTELPEGLRPADKMDVRVAFDAYFFKKGDYAAEGLPKGKRRVAALFVGRTLKVVPTVNPDEGYGETLLKIGMSFLVLTGVAILGFTVWYRRSDRRVEQRLRAARTTGFVPPPPDAVPMAQPVHRSDMAPGTPGDEGTPPVEPGAI